MPRVRIALIGLLIFLSICGIPAQSGEYQVKPGDTLYSIARRFGTSQRAIQQANEISDPRNLSIGQRLTIPGTYTVESGDTYWSISRRFETSVDELLALNDRREGRVLKEGETLLVPEVNETSPAQGLAENGGRETDATETDATETEATDTEATETEATEINDAGAATAEEPRDDGAVGVRKNPEVAETAPDQSRTVFWPHPGERRNVEGKFPGVAISARRGDSVYSVSQGRVIYAGPHTAFGRVVFVQTSDGYLYVYAGNSELSVNVGDQVRVGTRIGRVGSGASTGVGSVEDGAQLYFSVWKNNQYVDPTVAPRG